MLASDSERQDVMSIHGVAYERQHNDVSTGLCVLESAKPESALMSVVCSLEKTIQPESQFFYL